MDLSQWNRTELNSGGIKQFTIETDAAFREENLRSLNDEHKIRNITSLVWSD
jgi:hypothetical protein